MREKHEAGGAAKPAPSRRERLANELRANLKRRKVQDRTRHEDAAKTEQDRAESRGEFPPGTTIAAAGVDGVNRALVLHDLEKSCDFSGNMAWGQKGTDAPFRIAPPRRGACNVSIEAREGRHGPHPHYRRRAPE